MSAFERLVPLGEQVPYFLYFEIAPGDIDVNIHPTKTEIKFENEQATWQILSAAVKESIGIFNDVPSIDFDVQGKPEIPVFHTDVPPSAPRVPVNPQYNPFVEKSITRQKAPANWEELYQWPKQESSAEAEIFESKADPVSGPTIIEEKSPTHYQYKGKYIMTAVKSGLMIIDQHRAHIRILYEKYLAQQKNRKEHSQKLLFPGMLYLNASGILQLEKAKEELEDLGFEIVGMGGNAFAVNSAPAGLDGLDYVALINEMLSDSEEKGTSTKEEISRSLALSLARNAAIPQGEILNNEEMESVVNSLFACENVNYTPDGKSIFCILKQQDIEHLLR